MSTVTDSIAIHRAATRATGLNDFGDPFYEDGLECYIQACQDDPTLSDAGRMATWLSLVRVLEGRLHAVDGMKRQPSGHPITKPLFIIGPPRSGTTFLHHMLARDPQFQWLPTWLAQTPMPRRVRDQWGAEPTYRRAWYDLRAMQQALPDLADMHPMVADGPEQCHHVMLQTFASSALSQVGDVQAYEQWLFSRNLTQEYRYHAGVLGLVGGRSTRTWLLKCPHHAIGIEALLKTYPDARIVLLYRDPVDSIPSACRLVQLSRSHLENGKGTPDAIGDRVMRHHLEMTTRLHIARDQHPGRMFEVSYRELVRNPMGTVRRIYDRFDLGRALPTLPDIQPPKQPRAKPEDFGLTARGIQASFWQQRSSVVNNSDW